MQSQGTTSKAALKVQKMQVLRVEGKKIKDVLNTLIRFLEDCKCTRNVF